jgi:hypothetical protein
MGRLPVDRERGLWACLVEPPRERVSMLALEKAAPLALDRIERKVTTAVDDQLEHPLSPALSEQRDPAREYDLDHRGRDDGRHRTRHPCHHRANARNEHRRDHEGPLLPRPQTVQHPAKRMLVTKDSSSGTIRRVEGVSGPCGEVHGRASKGRPDFPAHQATFYASPGRAAGNQLLQPDGSPWPRIDRALDRGRPCDDPR